MSIIYIPRNYKKYKTFEGSKMRCRDKKKSVVAAMSALFALRRRRRTEDWLCSLSSKQSASCYTLLGVTRADARVCNEAVYGAGT
jgi:hypothetical protein